MNTIETFIIDAYTPGEAVRTARSLPGVVFVRKAEAVSAFRDMTVFYVECDVVKKTAMGKEKAIQDARARVQAAKRPSLLRRINAWLDGLWPDAYKVAR